jgi:hypothetical protein
LDTVITVEKRAIGQINALSCSPSKRHSYTLLQTEVKEKNMKEDNQDINSST